MYLSTFPRPSQSPFAAPAPERPAEQFDVGDRVTHAQHGLGRVIMAQASGVTVDFGSHRAWVASPFSSLSKL